MASANVHDRRSIARIYPPEAFAEDASVNDRATAEVLHGVRIDAAPDAAGAFRLSRARQQAGEMPGALFLAPFHRVTADEHAADERAADEHAAADPDPRQGYEPFLDDIIAAARRHGYRAEESPGPGEDPATGRPGDPRLRGLRQ